MKFEQPENFNNIKDQKITRLRTPEETLEERERRGERPFILHKKNGDQELVVIGLPHILSFKKINEIKHLIREKHPDIFLRGVIL